MDTVLFDLDGTLLPLDQDEFVSEYFSALTRRFSHLIEPRELTRSVWAATEAMIGNDGADFNTEVFWKAFSDLLGRDMRIHEPEFESFYVNEFSQAAKTAYPNTLADKCVKELKRRGYTLALATNPIFPAVATLERIRWAGLEPGDFAYISTYENSRFCKPNPRYFEELLQKIGKRPIDCIMVGNDTIEDGAAGKLGIPFYLLEGHVVDHGGIRAECFARGDFQALHRFILSLPAL